MRLFTKQGAEFTISEEQRALLILVTYDIRRDKLLASLFLSVLGAWQLWTWIQHRQTSTLLLCVVFAAAIVYFITSPNSYRTALTVTEFELRSEYAIGSGRVVNRLLAESVQELDFNYGSRALHASRYDFGMYAQLGRFQQTCILPLLDEAQVLEVRVRILDKFPNYSKEIKDSRGITTLGLGTL